MTDAPVGSYGPAPEEEGISLLALGSVLLRWRRAIVGLAIAGAIVGLISGLTDPKLFKSTTTFIPKASAGGSSGLALAASQLGFSIGQASADWGPPIYVELLRSRALLEPIARDTFVVAEENNRRVTFLELMGISAPTAEREGTAAVGWLNTMISATEAKKLGGVTVEVKTKWPSVSVALAQRLLDRVNEFNIETRKSQAVAERQFVEGQAAEAERALRSAEDRLQGFLQANRQWESSPGLRFEYERYNREVMRQSQLYTTWLQSREEARIREIRDIPVITVMESPRLPFRAEPRKTVLKAGAGAVGGAVFGVFLAFIADVMRKARRSKGEDAQEFFELLENAKPGFLRRKRVS